MKYQIQNLKDKKYVRFENGEVSAIQKETKTNNEYFNIINPYHESGCFNERIADSIRCIQEGLGDVLCVEVFFGLKIENVRKYLDEKAGDFYRQKSLAGWKNCKFGYGIEMREDSSKLKFYVDDENKLKLKMNRYANLKLFEDDERCKEFISKSLIKAKEIKKQYNKLKVRGGSVEYIEKLKEQPYFKNSLALMKIENKKFEFDIVQDIIRN